MASDQERLVVQKPAPGLPELRPILDPSAERPEIQQAYYQLISLPALDDD